MKKTLTLILLISCLKSFSQCDTIVLPVKMYDLSINVYGRVATISFKTSEEVNNDYFELQRSFDAINYQEVATVKPNITHNYSIQNEVEQDCFYRVRQVDKDGRYFLTKTFYVKRASDKDFNAYFAGNNISVNIEVAKAAPYIFSIKNFNGQEVITKYDTLFKGVNYLKLDAQTLPDGNYLISVFENRRLIKTLKIKK